MTKICKHHGPLLPELINKDKACILCKRSRNDGLYRRKREKILEHQKARYAALSKEQKRELGRKRNAAAKQKNTEGYLKYKALLQRKYRETLADLYVRTTLIHRGLSKDEISKDMIEVQRAILKIKRKAKENED